MRKERSELRECRAGQERNGNGTASTGNLTAERVAAGISTSNRACRIVIFARWTSKELENSLALLNYAKPQKGTETSGNAKILAEERDRNGNFQQDVQVLAFRTPGEAWRGSTAHVCLS